MSTTALSFDFYAGSQMGVCMILGTYVGTAPAAVDYCMVNNDSGSGVQGPWIQSPFLDTTSYGANKYGAIAVGPPNQPLSGTILIRVTATPTIFSSDNLTGPVGPAQAVMPFRDMMKM